MKSYIVNILFLTVLGIAVATAAETFSLTWWVFHAWAVVVLLITVPCFLSMILANSETFRQSMKASLKKSKPAAPWGKNTDAAIDLVALAGFISLGWIVASAAAIATLILSQYAFSIYEEIEQENSTGD